MIYPGGNHLSLRNDFACPNCGKPTKNTFPPNSIFIGTCCQEVECEIVGRCVIIEKATMMIVTIYPPMYYSQGKEGPEVVFPVLADKDGKRVWPKK